MVSLKFALFTGSDAGDSHQDELVPITQSSETEPDAPEASSTRTEAAPASVPFSDSGSESDGLPFVEAHSVVEKPEIAAPEEPAEDAMPSYAELPEPEWSQTECHMNVRLPECVIQPHHTVGRCPIVLRIVYLSFACSRRRCGTFMLLQLVRYSEESQAGASRT